MHVIFKKNNGFALVGLLMAVLIIGVLAYGSRSYFGKNNNGQNMQRNVKRQLDDIEKKNNELNNLKLDILNDQDKTASAT